jgi:hypothetical protein
LTEGGQQWIGESECRQTNTDAVDHKCSDEVLHDGAMAAPRNL